MHIHPLVTDTATLTELCQRLAQSPFIAVDTEFMRENTFWPNLCLIQIARGILGDSIERSLRRLPA